MGKKTHGHAARGRLTSEYKSWYQMLTRCRNENRDTYQLYKGRGISVCSQWLKFDSFLEDMGLKPAANMSIDRIDNNGNYDPGNCRWATQEEQGQNTNKTRLTPELVLKLRRGKLTTRQVANLTGCAMCTAQKARAGDTWKNIKESKL